jgi:uncharacterized protein
MPTADPAPILWRRLDRPGHESALLLQREDGWNLAGTAIFPHENEPCHLSFRIVCDPDWSTRSVDVTGWLGRETVLVQAQVGPTGEWIVNGASAPAIAGCVDIDLNFSPSTNLLPIRRFALAIGEERAVRAAWLRFPSFRIEPLEQSYRRLAADRYLYRSAGGFETELEVDRNGFVIRYPGFWEIESLGRA